MSNLRAPGSHFTKATCAIETLALMLSAPGDFPLHLERMTDTGLALKALRELSCARVICRRIADGGLELSEALARFGIQYVKQAGYALFMQPEGDELGASVRVLINAYCEAWYGGSRLPSRSERLVHAGDTNYQWEPRWRARMPAEDGSDHGEFSWSGNPVDLFEWSSARLVELEEAFRAHGAESPNTDIGVMRAAWSVKRDATWSIRREKFELEYTWLSELCAAFVPQAVIAFVRVIGPSALDATFRLGGWTALVTLIASQLIVSEQGSWSR